MIDYCTTIIIIADPHEAEIDPVSRSLPSRYGQRFTAPPLDLEDELNKPPLVRNPSLSFYEADNRMKEKSAKAEGGSQQLSRKYVRPLLSNALRSLLNHTYNNEQKKRTSKLLFSLILQLLFVPHCICIMNSWCGIFVAELLCKSSSRHSVPSQKSEEPEKHDVEVLLYRHARKLLATYRIRDLGLFAANLEEYELVAFLRKER